MVRNVNKNTKIGKNIFEQLSVTWFSFNLYFNSMKPVCIKYGDPVLEYEKALLNGVYLSWTDNVRHLGNCMCSNNDDLLDCTYKKSMFIGYVIS